MIRASALRIMLVSGCVGAVVLALITPQLSAVFVSLVGVVAGVYKLFLYLDRRDDAGGGQEREALKLARRSLRDSSKRILDFTPGRSSREGGDFQPPFSDVFCGLINYETLVGKQGFGELMRSQTVSHHRGPIFLLGPPGSGKSVTLQAIYLAAANSFLAHSLIPEILLGNDKKLEFIASVGVLAADARQADLPHFKIAEPQVSARSSRVARIAGSWRSNIKTGWLAMKHFTARWVLDPTWLGPAPPCFPLLLDLSRHERLLPAQQPEDITPDQAFSFLEAAAKESAMIQEDMFWWLFKQGKLCLLMDGLDEVQHGNRVKILEIIGHAMRRPGCDGSMVVVTCRTGVFAGLREGLEGDQLVYLTWELNPLAAEEAKEIIFRLVAVELNRKPNDRQGLLKDFEHRLGDDGMVRRRIRRPQVWQLTSDLADCIGQIIERSTFVKQQRWRPDKNPLSLRRITVFFLGRKSQNLQKRYDPERRQERWWMIGEGDFENYVRLVRDDVLEYIRRRRIAYEVFDAMPDEVLSWYGRFAFQMLWGRETTKDDVTAFLEPLAKARTGEDFLEAFLLPGVLTEREGGRLTFRDLETQYVLAAEFACNDREAKAHILSLVRGVCQRYDDDNLAIVLAMALEMIKQEVLEEILPGLDGFSNPMVLEVLLQQRAGTRQLSATEAAPLLRKCLHEFRKESSGSARLRLWEAVRLVVHGRYETEWAEEELMSLLLDGQACAHVRGNAALVLAEMLFPDRRAALLKIAAQVSGNREEDMWVRACALLALKVLEPGKVEPALDAELLRVRIPDGQYRICKKRVGEQPVVITVKDLWLARFPVLEFEMQRWRNREDELSPATIFKPATGITITEAYKYADSQGACLPRAVEYQVAASYSAPNGKGRRYPWGEEFDDEISDLLTACVPGTGAARSQARRIFLTPRLATPGGVSDVTGNIRQLTADESTAEVRVGRGMRIERRVATFGLPVLDAAFPQNYLSVETGEVRGDGGQSDAGFRLAWRQT